MLHIELNSEITRGRLLSSEVF